MNALNWETLGVIVALLALGLPVLWKLSRATAHLDDLKDRFGECKREDRADHEDFRRSIKQQGITLADHEQRITTLEAD